MRVGEARVVQHRDVVALANRSIGPSRLQQSGDCDGLRRVIPTLAFRVGSRRPGPSVGAAGRRTDPGTAASGVGDFLR
jgi:hypothetical protein